METAPGHMSQLKKETTSRSSPISHPDCSGEGCSGASPSCFLPKVSGGFRLDFLNSHPNSGQSPHQLEPAGFSHFFPPGLTAPCSRSLLTLQVRIQKSTARLPQPQSPSSLLQGRPGTSGRAIQIYIYFGLFYFLFRVFFWFCFVIIFNSFQ